MSSDSPPKAAPPTVAQQIFRRATDLLAISLIVMVGLTAGREITAWWRAAETPPIDAGLVDPQVEWSQRAVELQFGESSTSIQRVPFYGDQDAVVQRLIALARSLWETEPADLPPSDEEREWLTTLERLEPEESQVGHGSIYVMNGLFPSVAVTMEKNDVSRLAGWGIAMPAGDKLWTLMMFRPSGSTAESGETKIPLPDDARPLLGWHDANGNRVMSFQGTGRIEEWLAHFDQRFGPRLERKSAANLAGHTARWRTPDGQIDVQLSRQGDQITGLLWMTAPSGSQNGEKSLAK